MPIQEPVLSDIARTLKTDLQSTNGTLSSKKSGMGAYLEVASRIKSVRRAGISDGYKPDMGASLKKQQNGTLKGNTVFRITRNGVTTLKTQQDQNVAAKKIPAAHTRKQLLQRQNGAHMISNNPRSNDDRYVVDNKSLVDEGHHRGFYHCPRNSLPAGKRSTLCGQYFSRPVRCPMPSSTLTRNVFESNAHQQPGSFTVTSGRTKIHNFYSNQNRAGNVSRIKSTTKLKINQNLQRSSPNSTDMCHQMDKITPRGYAQVQTLPENESSNLISNLNGKPLFTVGSDEVSPAYNFSNYSVPGKVCRLKKSRSLISISDILTRLGSSPMLPNSEFSPLQRGAYRLQSSRKHYCMGVRSWQTKNSPYHQKNFHDSLVRARRKLRYLRRQALASHFYEPKLAPRSPVLSRDSSARHSYVRYYKVKKRTKLARHEPYSKASSHSLKTWMPSPTCLEISQAINRNNCSPLKKRQSMMYHPIFGNLSTRVGHGAASSDSSCESSDLRETRLEPRVNKRTELQSNCIRERSENKECDASCRNRSRYINDCRGEIDIFKSLEKVADAEIEPGNKRENEDKSKDSNDLLVTSSDEDSCLSNSKLCDTNTPNNFQAIKTPTKFSSHEPPVIKTRACSTTVCETDGKPKDEWTDQRSRSHTTQTESSAAVSHSVAVQTSPRRHRVPSCHQRAGVAVQTSPRRQRVPRCHQRAGSHVIQELIKFRAREMKMDRSLKNAGRRCCRPYLHRLLQQNNALFKAKNTEKPYTALTTKTIDSEQKPFPQLGHSNGYAAERNEGNGDDFNDLPGRKLEQTNCRSSPNATDSERWNGTTQSKQSCTRTFQLCKHPSSQMASGVGIGSTKNYGECLQKQEPKKSTFQDNGYPSVQAQPGHVALKKQTNNEQIVTKKANDESGKSSVIQNMCLVRPSWKNVNIEEVDRRVKRALRLRHQLQMSRLSAGKGDNHDKPTDTVTPDQSTLYSEGNLQDGFNRETENLAISDRSRKQLNGLPINLKNSSAESKHLRKEGQKNVCFLRDPTDRCSHPPPADVNRTMATHKDMLISSHRTIARHHELCEDIRVHTERSLSAQDFSNTSGSDSHLPERSASAQATPAAVLKRLSVESKMKNSPPTKISRTENQTFKKNTPRLVGSLVQRLPQVPLSSFVEWFIETSDPNNFLIATSSHTSADDIISRSKSTSGEHITLGQSPCDRNAHAFVGKSPKETNRPTASAASSEKLDLKRLGTVTNSSSKSHVLVFSDRGHDSELPKLYRGEESHMTLTSNWCQEQSSQGVKTSTSSLPVYQSDTPVASHKPSFFERSIGSDGSTTSFDRQRSTLKPFHTLTSSDETETASSNSLCLKLPVLLTGTNSFGGGNIRDALGGTDKEQEGSTEQNDENKSQENTHYLQGVSAPSSDAKPFMDPVVVSGDQAAGIGCSEEIMGNTSKDQQQRRGPGIRQILMKLQQSDTGAGKREGVRITLRRSSDVSGIIAKFQDKNS